MNASTKLIFFCEKMVAGESLNGPMRSRPARSKSKQQCIRPGVMGAFDGLVHAASKKKADQLFAFCDQHGQ